MTRDDMVDLADLSRESHEVEGYVEVDESGPDLFVLSEPGEYNRWIEAERAVDLENWR